MIQFNKNPNEVDNEQYMFPKYDTYNKDIIRTPFTHKLDQDMKKTERMCPYCGKGMCVSIRRTDKERMNIFKIKEREYNEYTCSNDGAKWRIYRSEKTKSVVSMEYVIPVLVGLFYAAVIASMLRFT